MSIAAISSQDLIDAGATGLGDLKSAIPALSVDSAAGFLLVHLRGVGSIATGAGVENPVALYIDGVYHANQSVGAAKLNNIARIEVLKGPQGTLFGRNTTGGAGPCHYRGSGRGLPAGGPDLIRQLSCGRRQSVRVGAGRVRPGGRFRGPFRQPRRLWPQSCRREASSGCRVRRSDAQQGRLSAARLQIHLHRRL